MQQHSRDWLILSHAHLRVPELEGLLQQFGSVASITRQKLADLKATGLADEKCAAIASPDEARIDTAGEWLEHKAHHLVEFGADSYPEMLSQIAGAPPGTVSSSVISTQTAPPTRITNCTASVHSTAERPPSAV